MSEMPEDVLARQAAAYVRGRPDYPVAIEDWLRRELDLGPGKTVVDLGSGTGKFLPRLLATGATIIAIEPLAGMRAHLTALYPNVDAVEARAQALPLADGSVDTVTCAQCFHLFATKEALQEIRRVLKPGGALCLMWNIRDMTESWVRHIVEIMAPYDHHATRFDLEALRAAFPADGFSALQETRFANPQAGSPENVIINRVLSTRAIAVLPQAERDAVIARVRALMAATPVLAGKPTITFPNHCYAYHCRKIA